MKAALIDNQNNVINVIVWDDTCIAPEGTTALVLEDNVRVQPEWIFDANNNRFIPSQPYPSWSFNEDTYSWEAPVEKPDNNYFYIWNEENGEWEIQ
jgi:hypothetical protein